MAKIDHRKNNARLRGLRDHEPTEAQKKRDKKLGATPEWKEKMARKALKMRASEVKQKKISGGTAGQPSKGNINANTNLYTKESK